MHPPTAVGGIQMGMFAVVRKDLNASTNCRWWDSARDCLSRDSCRKDLNASTNCRSVAAREFVSAFNGNYC